ncbi:MAG TPA: hypothetical protein VJS88_03580, partial [Chthoniobacterales bacterium]|nr:hypothetical protein [Chthoniobacterales bacterium]
TQKNRATAAARRNPRKKVIARGSAGRLDGLSGSTSQRRDIGSAELAVEVQPGRKILDEFSVGPARAAAQLVVEMANDHATVSEIRQAMQKRDGIATAGNANKIAPGRWKFREKIFRQRELHDMRRPSAPNRVKEL